MARANRPKGDKLLAKFSKTLLLVLTFKQILKKQIFLTLHWTHKMLLIVHTRNLTITCFTSTLIEPSTTNHQTVTKFPFLKDCRIRLLTKKFLIQRKLNVKMHLKSRVIMLIWNKLTTNQKNQKHESEIWYGLTQTLANSF